MGLYLGMRNSIRKNGFEYENKKVSKYDPNPTNFLIKKFEESNGNLAILVNYPNCKNFEGDKIIVYKNTTWEQVNSLKELDPHFTNEIDIKPFARFEPTEEGWGSALELLTSLNLSDKKLWEMAKVITDRQRTVKELNNDNINLEELEGEWFDWLKEEILNK